MCRKLFQIQKKKVCPQGQGPEDQVPRQGEKQLGFSPKELMQYSGNLDKMNKIITMI